jgi:hypothetical protein
MKRVKGKKTVRGDLYSGKYRHSGSSMPGVGAATQVLVPDCLPP